MKLCWEKSDIYNVLKKHTLKHVHMTLYTFYPMSMFIMKQYCIALAYMEYSATFITLLSSLDLDNVKLFYYMEKSNLAILKNKYLVFKK